jgi:hypothetical protein
MLETRSHQTLQSWQSFEHPPQNHNTTIPPGQPRNRTTRTFSHRRHHRSSLQSLSPNPKHQPSQHPILVRLSAITPHHQRQLPTATCAPPTLPQWPARTVRHDRRILRLHRPTQLLGPIAPRQTPNHHPLRANLPR